MGKKKQTQHQDVPRGSRRDILLIVLTTLAVSMFISAAIPIGCAASLMGKYHRFIQDLGTSLMYAREHGSLEMTVAGEAQEADLSQAEAFATIAPRARGPFGPRPHRPARSGTSASVR